jgi:concanavalin A-like lectin/glucanase superfamily protein
MKKTILIISLIILSAQTILPGQTYSPNLAKAHLISCNNVKGKNQIFATVPQTSGALMIPVSKPDLSGFDRVKITITPISGQFQARYFAVALRNKRAYAIGKMVRKPVIADKKPIELIFDIANTTRTKVNYLRLYFNRTGKIDKPVKFRLDSAEFYKTATNIPGKTYSPDLDTINLISCQSPQIRNQVITALPLKSGAIMIPTNNLDLTRYDRVRIRITPITGKFQVRSFNAALRGNGKYSFAKLARQPVIKDHKPIKLIYDIAKLPREKVEFLRLYFNRTGKIDKPVKFRLDSVEFYKTTMISRVPLEKYQRKLAKTLIFPRIQIKYSLFMNYYSVPTRDLWIERPLLFDRELIAGTKEFKKEGNLASFKKNADIVSTYLDGFSILATSKSYLQRTLASMRYADKLGLKNFIMLEVSPAITALGKNAKMTRDYDFIFKIVKAAEKSPSAFRIKDKVILSSYCADAISPEQWAPVIKSLKKASNNRLIFISEIRNKYYKANYAYKKNGGKVSSETIQELKEFIRSYLDVSDGLLFAGCNHVVKDSNEISNYKFGDAFYKNILIPTIISVFNEPKYKSKYLGLSAAKGYFYKRHASGGQNEGGTLTLRQSLETALGAKPDFIIMPEWNEANENTHIEPTVYDSFATRRVINHYHKAPVATNDNRTLPNLIISYRSELVYGETLSIELLNLPDLKYQDATTKVELCLKNNVEKVIKRFAPLTLSNRKLDVKYIKIPVENFNRERILIPELSITRNGKMQVIKGLSCVMLKTPPNMNKKYVKQPIRDLCTTKQAVFQWSREKDEIKVKGSIETESPLSTVELLENNVPVAAVDINREYQCADNETLLRFSWNSRSNAKETITCVIKPLTGTVNSTRNKYIVMSESSNAKTNKRGKTIRKNLRFTTHIDEFFFKASKNAKLDISIGEQKVQFPVADVMKFGIYRRVFGDNKTIAVEAVRRLPEIPYPIKQKSIDFKLTAKAIFPNPVYTIRAITTSGKTFRSKPYFPEKLSGKKISMNAWSYSKNKVITLNIPPEYGHNIQYDFTSAAGDVLPTIQPYRFLYGKLGGVDRWSKSFNKPGTASAPVWKIKNGRSVLEFDGIGNYLIFPVSLVSEQSFSLSFSIMPQTDSKQTIMQTYCSTHPGFQLLLQEGSLSGYFLNRKGKSYKFKTKSHLITGKWNNITISYDMKNISFKINDNATEKFKCNGILYRQPCLIFGGSFPAKGTHRFKGLLRSFSYANYVILN